MLVGWVGVCEYHGVERWTESGWDRGFRGKGGWTWVEAGWLNLWRNGVVGLDIGSEEVRQIGWCLDWWGEVCQVWGCGWCGFG